MRYLIWAERASRVAVWVGGGLMIVAAVMVTVDVVLRKLFNANLGGADELSGYLFGIATAWAFSFTLLHRANVRIDALTALFPRRVRAVLDVLGLALLTLFVTVLTWRAALLFQDSVEFWSKSITPLQTPLAIPQALWLLGLCLYLATLVVVLATTVWALVRGDLATVQEIAGVRGADEEVEEEVRVAARRRRRA